MEYLFKNTSFVYINTKRLFLQLIEYTNLYIAYKFTILIELKVVY